MRSTRAVLTTAAAALAALSLAACSAEVVDGPEDESDPGGSTTTATAPVTATEPATDAPATGVIAPVTLPAGATWLYAVEHSPGTGDQVSVDYNGSSVPNSTGFLVSCDGDLVTTEFALGGAFELLTGHLVLRDGAPEDLAVRVYLQLDGVDLESSMIFKSEASIAETVGGVDDGHTGDLDALVEGGDVLSVSTQLEEGTCGTGDPYVVLAETYLTPAS